MDSFASVVMNLFGVVVAIIAINLSYKIKKNNKDRRANAQKAVKKMMYGDSQNNENIANSINYIELANRIFERARMDLKLKEATGDYKTETEEYGLFDHTVRNTVETTERVKYSSRFSNTNSPVTTEWEVGTADDFDKLYTEIKKRVRFTDIHVEYRKAFGVATIYFFREL